MEQIKSPTLDFEKLASLSEEERAAAVAEYTAAVEAAARAALSADYDAELRTLRYESVKSKMALDGTLPHFGERIGAIEEIIASTNYSHGYVCREFKRFMGKTLQDYLAETRFSYAISLLANNENSVAQVAEKLGYNATSNFIIAFRNKYGVTPAQWRKEKT